MAHNILSDAELKMLLAPDYPTEEIIQPRRLRLSLKYLYQLIGEIQQDKLLLAARVDELEQQLYELYQIQAVEATTQEMLITVEAQLQKETEEALKAATPEFIEMTRSERHPKPEKTSFWDFLFRH
jgi:hypothetical protein